MGKKSKTDDPPVTSAGGFQDSPFAALAKLSLPGATEEGAASTPPVKTEGTVGPSVRKPASPKSPGRVVLRRETKHRGGKAVVIVSGLDQLEGFDRAAIEEFARQLKHQLGCGGTVEARDDICEIVLQGDRAAKVAELLRARGFRVDGVTA